MSKKLLLAILVLVILVYVFMKFFVGRPLTAGILPQSSIISMEVRKMNQARERIRENAYWKNTLSQLDFGQLLDQRLNQLNTIFLEVAKGPYRDPSILISLHNAGKEKFEYLFAFKEGALGGTDKLVSYLQEQNYSLSKNQFKGASINRLSNPANDEKIAIAEHQDYIFISWAPTLVEESVGQLADNKNIANMSSFDKMKAKRLNAKGIKCLVNGAKIPLLSSGFLDDQNLEGLQPFAESIDWLKLDFTLNDSQLKYEGYAYLNEANQYLRAFEGISPSKDGSTVASIMPDNMALLWAANVHSFNSFYKQLPEKENRIFKEYCMPWIGNEWAYGIVEPLNRRIDEKKLVAIESKKARAAQAYLGDLANAVSKNNDSRDLDNNSRIRYLGNKDIVSALFGEETAMAFDECYYMILERWVLLATEPSTLELMLSGGEHFNSLANSPTYQQFIKNMNPNSNHFSFVQTDKIPEILRMNASRAYKQYLNGHLPHYYELNPATLEAVTTSDDLIKIKGSVGSEIERTKDPVLVWEVPLRDVPRSSPQVVENPSTGEKDIFVQDQSNNIYLISSNGTIRWKRSLEKEILGEVYPIQLYGGQKSQLLFNTPSKVYLLERETGEDVDSYPLRLSSRASAGMCMVDFKSNKEYSYYIPCGNLNVYGYTATKQLIDGWSPLSGIGLIEYPIQHFKFKKKDYLVAVNDNGNIYLLDRLGRTIFKEVLGVGLMSAPTIDILSNKVSILAYGKDGMNYTIEFNEELRDMETKLVSRVEKEENYFVANVVGDAQAEKVFFNRNKITAYGDAGPELIAILEPEIRPSEIFPVKLSSRLEYNIGLFQKDQKKAYLLDDAGMPLKGFPVDCSTPFVLTDLRNTREDILIGGGLNNSILAYRIQP